jgi:hypothetical protein
VLDVDDGAMRAFTPEGIGFSWALSPDGRRAAVGTSRGVELFRVDGGSDGLSVGTVPDLRQDLLLAWIEDGLLVNDGATFGRVLLVDAVSGRRELWREILPRDPGGIMNIGAFVVTPEGRSYAYWWLRALSDLYLVSGLG